MSMPDSAMHSGIKASVRLWRKAEICPRPDWADNVIGGEILVVPEVMPRTWATDPALVRPRRSRLGYPGSGEIDMHVHLPKPLHGWRELLGEIGVIVIGVLIALGAEQTVEWLQWKSELAETREALNLELTHAMGAFQYRITLQGCINHRLDELSRWLAKSQPGDKLPLARAIGQPLGYAILTGTWETAKGGQVGRPPAHLPTFRRLPCAGQDGIAQRLADGACQRELVSRLRFSQPARKLVQPVVDATLQRDAVLERAHGMGQLQVQGFARLRKLAFPLQPFDGLFGAQRDQHTDHDDPDFAQQFAPAVQRLRQMDMHVDFSRPRIA